MDINWNDKKEWGKERVLNQKFKVVQLRRKLQETGDYGAACMCNDESRYNGQKETRNTYWNDVETSEEVHDGVR